MEKNHGVYILGHCVTGSGRIRAGYGLAVLYNLTYSTAFLSTAPGGMVEMGLTAAAVGGDVSVVTSYQLFRLLVIMLFVPFFFKWLAGKFTDKQ
ncbi:hypothetical protein EU245_10000 [Lentibacillus lipolyticus]|nr:hypothetical protein EU245_10000 [Lentibacillus lipolyticus]